MNYKIFIYFILTLLFLLIFFIFLQGRNKKTTPIALPKIIAHKAYYKNYAPNSLEAVAAIIKEQKENKIAAIEIDLIHLKDGNIILFHDDDLSPLTEKKGDPRQKTYEEIKNLSIIYKGKKTRSKIPILQSIFDKAGNKLIYILDCKAQKYLNSNFARDLLALIKRYPHLKNNIIIASFNPFFLYHIRRLDKNINIMYSFETDSIPFAEEKNNNITPHPSLMRMPQIQNLVQSFINPDYLNIRHTISKQYRQKLLKNNRPIIFWTIDDTNLAEKFLDEGIASIISNRASELQKELFKK